MIEVRDQALDDLAHIDIDVGLHRNIDRGAVMPSEASEAVEGLSQRIEPGDRDRQRSLLLSLCHDLIDPIAQLEIGAAERLFRRQQRKRRGAARRLLGDGVRRGELKAIGAVAI